MSHPTARLIRKCNLLECLVYLDRQCLAMLGLSPRALSFSFVSLLLHQVILAVMLCLKFDLYIVVTYPTAAAVEVAAALFDVLAHTCPEYITHAQNERTR